MIAHFLGQNQKADQVVVVILHRLLDALAHGLQAREMDHRVDPIVVKRLADGRAVAQIALAERQILSGNFADAVERIGLGVDEIVDHDHLVARVQQLHARMTSDKAGAAGHQYLHTSRPFISFYASIVAPPRALFNKRFVRRHAFLLHSESDCGTMNS